jgi:hypothetical protein
MALPLEDLERVKALVDQGLTVAEIWRAMKWKSRNRAVCAVAHVKKYPDLEWSLVNGLRRAMLVPSDPTRRPTRAELEAFLLRQLEPDPVPLGPGMARWIVKFARANDFGDLADLLVQTNDRVRRFAWTPEKLAALRKSVPAAPRSPTGG